MSESLTAMRCHVTVEVGACGTLSRHNYRARVKKGAVGNKDDFEDKVKMNGLNDNHRRGGVYPRPNPVDEI